MTTQLGRWTWKTDDLLPNGDRKSCFQSHMGLWLMEPSALKQRADEIIMRLASERPIDASESPKVEYWSAGGNSGVFSDETMPLVAMIPIHGAITKKRSKFAETSALEVRSLIRQVAADPQVSRIVLHIDSPGGSVAGIDDLAAEVRAAAKIKPVVAYCEDLCASAGYWIASQATEIVANRSAFVGSLGVYCTVYDTSGKFERDGVKVHVISSGGVKGAGVPGTPLTDEQLADQQRVVDAIADLFKENVSAGRGLSKAETDALFDGRVHGAGKALALGLIDRIGTLESTFSEGDVEPKKDEDEDEDEDSPESEPSPDEEDEMKKEDAAKLLAEDLAEIALSVKEAGCALSLPSIEAKLLGEATRHENEIDALFAAQELGKRLAGLKKVAGGFHSAPTKESMTVVPSDPKAIRREWTAKFDEYKKTAKNWGEAVILVRDNHPELHKAYIESYQR